MEEPATARRAPIGVFDSGVGGLTVLRALRDAMPGEDFVYLGDTARLPYGTKSADTVVRYSMQCASLLVERGIRGLVVACNTASASALSALRTHHPALPVIGVVEPGARAAVAASAARHVAVIATEATIGGGAYQRAIAGLDAAVRVTARACSLFVSMAEEGWTSGPIAEAVAHRYLDPVFDTADPPDTLVLGCTHFPALAGAIRAVLPPGVRVVDSAQTTAAEVRERLDPATASRPVAGPAGHRSGRGAAIPRGRVTWLATDGAARFAHVGSGFLGEPLDAGNIEIVDLSAGLRA
ncbi:MAG TPA: glutamate racemase [Steroidobacteraceae bacterium]|nr:glutamate racemase [Steroidobacteraceae bacterium]